MELKALKHSLVLLEYNIIIMSRITIGLDGILIFNIIFSAGSPYICSHTHIFRLFKQLLYMTPATANWLIKLH